MTHSLFYYLTFFLSSQKEVQFYLFFKGREGSALARAQAMDPEAKIILTTCVNVCRTRIWGAGRGEGGGKD
jgi:hypothetical protein